MTDAEFDDALIGAAFSLAAAEGWRGVTVAAAARRAELPLDRARRRFPDKTMVLLRFARKADEAALADVPEDGSPRDRLFDLVMRRFDILQQHRDGVRAVLRDLPFHPGLALGLAMTTGTSMAWLLNAAGISTAGLGGQLRVHGLGALWLYSLRAWSRDDSPDLSGTMAALDRALTRAEQVGDLLAGGAPTAAPKSFPEISPAPDEAAAGI